MNKGNDRSARTRAQGPITLEGITERITLIRRLVALSLDFDSKARTHAELAQAGLTELEAALAHSAQKGGAQ